MSEEIIKEKRPVFKTCSCCRGPIQRISIAKCWFCVEECTFEGCISPWTWDNEDI